MISFHGRLYRFHFFRAQLFGAFNARYTRELYRYYLIPRMASLLLKLRRFMIARCRMPSQHLIRK